MPNPSCKFSNNSSTNGSLCCWDGEHGFIFVRRDDHRRWPGNLPREWCTGYSLPEPCDAVSIPLKLFSYENKVQEIDGFLTLVPPMEKGFSGVCHPGVLVNVLMSWLLNYCTIFGVPLSMSFECFFLFWICRVCCKARKLEEGIGLLFSFPSFRVVCPSLFPPLHHGVKLMNLLRAST
jgi:hypothetical protein